MIWAKKPFEVVDARGTPRTLADEGFGGKKTGGALIRQWLWMELYIRHKVGLAICILVTLCFLWVTIDYLLQQAYAEACLYLLMTCAPPLVAYTFKREAGELRARIQSQPPYPALRAISISLELQSRTMAAGCARSVLRHGDLYGTLMLMRSPHCRARQNYARCDGPLCDCHPTDAG